ncbi:iron complex transport system permease protein [Williamsia sterculiae]|uniref:Iron complex transport system permease protein n=2 Tax=Williamsia sterculiae TaxID=1344003 RepID=A0A1N7FTD9_9NOCA|nr:iron complex transport system permease protein [Williamsia sterculiae]
MTDLPDDRAISVMADSRRRRARRLCVSGLIIALLLVAVFVVTLSVGTQRMTFGDVVSTLVGQGTTRTDLVVLRLRMPRALTSMFVGAALGLAGAVFQRVLRNTLASPDVVGIGAGAAVGAVTASVTLGLSGAAVSGSAVVGAVVAAAVIMGLARKDGLQDSRFVLIGVGISSVLMAIVSYQMIRASLTSAQQSLVWLTGSVAKATWSSTVPLIVSCAVLIPAAAIGCAVVLPRLELGDDLAIGLGLGVARARVGLIVVGVLLVATAVAAAGPVSFVALMSGPTAARIAGPGRGSVLHAAGIGALLISVSDLVARHLIADVALPVGVVTGALGAPYMLWLLARTRSGGTP